MSTYSSTTLGGKGSRLLWLIDEGFAVPRTEVLPRDVFDSVTACFPSNLHMPVLVGKVGRPGWEDAVAAAHTLAKQLPVSDDVMIRLRAIYDLVAAGSPDGLAVRSSATCEDARNHSFAGLAMTKLGVRSFDGFVCAVREVWASLFLPRAISYLAHKGIFTASMAVVVQAMAPADVAGIATIEEVGGERRMIVNAIWGLGEPLVSGTTNPDVFEVRFSDSTWQVDEHAVVKEKRMQVAPAPGEGLVFVDVAPEKRNDPCLTPSALSSLASVLGKLPISEEKRWETEFAFDVDGELSLLQVRPLVNDAFPQGGTASTVWSATNLGEALPGVATPLTWSVASAFAELGFRRAFSALGCSFSPNVRLFTNVHGRFYLNLTAFMAIAARVPQLTPRMLLSLSGGVSIDSLEPAVLQKLFPKQDKQPAGRTLQTLLAAGMSQATLPVRLAIQPWHRATIRKRFDETDLPSLTDAGLSELLRDILRELDDAGSLMLACASSSMTAFVVLQWMLQWLDAIPENRDATEVTGALLADTYDEGLASAKPALALLDVAQVARQDAPFLESMLQDPTPISLDALPDGNAKSKLLAWFADFGFRAVREADIATPRWNEDPSYPLQTLALYLRTRATQRPESFDHETSQLVKKRVGPVTYAMLLPLIVRARRLSRLREDMRSQVTWTLSTIRRLVLDAERRISVSRSELEPGFVFFCTVQEVLSALFANNTDNLPRLIAMRKAEYVRNLARPDPPATFVGQPPMIRRFTEWNQKAMRGLVASAGVVRGKVRVLLDVADGFSLQPGEILVTKTTDIGWTPLFVAAAGVVTELGGPLSHAAIVARELGVPCLVNVANATQILTTGEEIELDATSGTIVRNL